MMLITLKEYIGNQKFEDVPADKLANAKDLILRVNKWLEGFERWLLKRDSVLRMQSARINSGCRTPASNAEIYRVINARRLKQGLAPVPVATKSTHLDYNGVDLGDEYDLMKEYIAECPESLEEADLWIEHPDFTDTWLHFQRVKFGSYKPGGTRAYRPY